MLHIDEHIHTYTSDQRKAMPEAIDKVSSEGEVGYPYLLHMSKLSEIPSIVLGVRIPDGFHEIVERKGT